MPSITLELTFTNETDAKHIELELELEAGIQESLEESTTETAEQLGKGWEYQGCTELYNDGFDETWKLESFDDLEDFAAFAARVEEHGEAYELRAADLLDTDFDFDDCYNGCWSSTEEFVQNLVEDCYSLELPTFLYIDWERTARDVMMDYTECEGSEGIHIFRD